MPKRKRKKFAHSQYAGQGYANMTVIQKQYEDSMFPMWAAIQDCERDNCIAAQSCPYDYNRVTASGEIKQIRCQVVLRYLREVEAMIAENFGDELSNADLFRVGMHLIPLYKQLARFKITEMSITSNGVAEMTRSGTTKVNSLFKEIRDLIVVIDKTWRELGFTKARQREVPDLVNANPSYYEQMEKAALKEQKTDNLKLVKKHGTSR